MVLIPYGGGTGGIYWHFGGGAAHEKLLIHVTEKKIVSQIISSLTEEH